MLNQICKFHPAFSRLCEPDFPWPELIVGALLSILFYKLLTAPKALLSILNVRYFKFYGKWKRYGLGFYEKENKLPIHEGNVLIFPIPSGAPAAISRNPTYTYMGRTSLEAGNLYIYWRGTRHPERMLSVYKEPLHVGKTTCLIGVKSCITRVGEPAANVEILSKRELSDEELVDLIGGDRQRIVIKDPVITESDYDRKQQLL